MVGLVVRVVINVVRKRRRRRWRVRAECGGAVGSVCGAAAVATFFGAIHVVDGDVLFVFDKVARLARMLVLVVVGGRVACVDLLVAVAASE